MIPLALKRSYSTRLSAQNWCFLKRFAPETLDSLPEERLHSLLSTEDAALKEAGHQVLLELGIHYLSHHFPRLNTIASLPSLAKRLFSAPVNLQQLAQQYGAPSPEHLLQLIGALKENWGLTRVLSHLQKTYSRNTAPLLPHQQNALLPPPLQAYPIVELSTLNDREELTFKLHQESGRLSNNSMYIVGVYQGGDCLGEGYGASIALAQQRACLDALRKKFLGREPDFKEQ